jgi:class 3 adenylate cyclase
MTTSAPVVVVREPGRSALFVIVREPLEVGRGGSGLLLDDPSVSRHHLELRPAGNDGVVVVDLGSVNGTTLDGRRITGPENLEPGAVLRLGDTTVERRVAGAAGLLDPGASLPAYTSIERVAAQASRDRPRPPPAAWGEGTVTIVFSDIESSTELAHRHGDQRWFEILAAHNDIIRSDLGPHGGVEIKSQGDGFMLAFASARNAIQCMIQAERDVTAMGQDDPQQAIKVRFGAHTGEAIVDDDGDLFGHHVNVAARIADQAVGGEILVSSLVREIVEARGDLHFGEPRAATLKGLSGTWRLHPVEWEG